MTVRNARAEPHSQRARPRAVRLIARLTPSEVPPLLYVAALFARAEITVRVLTLPRVAKLHNIRLVSGESLPSNDTPPIVMLTAAEQRYFRAARKLSRNLYSPERGCLRRSLVVGHLLRRHEPVLCIGVRREREAGFDAHAWLEIQGFPLEPVIEHLPLIASG